MRVGSARFESLASPAFIATLAVLVINDVALKPLFHNALTGKLSDFAGLFALTLFLATLWPRHARVLGVLVVAAFAFWKTSHAAPLIDWLNTILPFAVGRTVDLTDLVALPVVPLAVWAAPRLTPCPLPRALQLGLVIVALVAFTATSRARYAARNVMDVTPQVVVDEPLLQSFFDEIAAQHGLRCEVCVPLAEGRVYVPEHEGNVHALIVKLDRETLEFTASGYDRERGVRVLSRRIRSEVEERFPALVVIDSTTGPLHEFGETTIFVVRGLSGSDIERQKGTFSAIVGDVARAQGLESDKAAQYYTEDGFDLEYSSFQVVPILDEDGMLLVKVSSRSPERDDALKGAVDDQLAMRLAAAFGTENVTRHVSPMLPVEWVY